MKKTVSLLLALVLCFSLTACGGKKGPSEEQLTAITDAYNEAANLYKEVSSNAQENGWMEDQETADAIKAIGDKLEPVGAALDGDISDLGEDADFDQLPGELRGYLPELEALEEKVTERYVVIPEAIREDWLAARSELRELYDQAYQLADTQGYLAAEDEWALTWLNLVEEYLEELEAGFPNEPEVLEDREVFERKYNHHLSAVKDLIQGMTFSYEVSNGRDAT